MAKLEAELLAATNAADARGRSQLPLALNIMFKLIDNEFLITYYALNKITNRNDSNKLFSIQHREMAYAPLCHEGHALFNGLFGPRNQHPCLHDIANHRRGRIFDYESNIPRKVSLGDDAKEYLTIHHDQRTNVFVRHFCHGIDHGGIRVNGPSGSTLLVE